jgi:hypothetical protein
VRNTLNLLLLTPLLVSISGCSSSQPATTDAKQASPSVQGAATMTGKNPLAKYIELAGFRLSESGAGKMKVKFSAINHSDADLGDLTVKIRLFTNVSKPGDEPITEFQAKVPSLGPEETKDVDASATTKLRLYELPDWQFLRYDFDVVSPAP